jgi:hypothetical protein
MTGESGTGETLYVRPGNSRGWQGFVLLLHLLAAAAVMLADLPFWARSAGLLLGSLSLAWEIRHGFPLRQPGGIRAMALDGRGEWHLETEEGQSPARLLAASRVWSQILWLRFQTGGRRFWVLVPCDALPPDDFRRLRGRLRQSRHLGHATQS